MILKSNFYDLRGSVIKLSKTQITSQLIFVSFKVHQPPCQQQLPVNVESHFNGHQIYLKMILKNSVLSNERIINEWLIIYT